MWQSSAIDCNNLVASDSFSPAQPLSCGQNHMEMWGSTGYTDSGHWCSRAAKILPESPGWVCFPEVLVPLRVNHAGDVECMSDNRRDCFWQQSFSDCQRLADNAPLGLIPLVCGSAHNTEYGGTGYDTPGHWCQMGAIFYGLGK
ncbi:TPA: hypothetical protein N0F65_011389 [Lagenidium giganteum]|uniref:Uncharacterized protein n=1 Tax=Lagenidium giganteum TaxID=4803 RepID=A0AAV2Z2P4_9STRA|nr:TPA: hypothetical protein N0F65_011389 [Lagenidium giganteum]